MRPDAAPRGTPPALSWSHAVLRGLKRTPAWTVMGSVRPARRFDAHRAYAEVRLPSRLAPDGGPPCTFALLQRPIATPPHRPADPKTGLPDDASSPGLSCPTTRAGAVDPRSAGLPAPLRAASEVWLPPSRRPPPPLPTPEGVGASMGFPLQGLAPRVDRRPSRAPCPRVVGRVDSPRPHGERADAVDFRASLPTRSRASPDPLRDPSRRCLPGVVPSRAFSPSAPDIRFGSRSLPSHALGGVTSRLACVSGSSEAEGSACPSRDRRLSWGLPPHDRRGVARTGTGCGLMVSPRRSGALQAARSTLSILVASPTEAFAPARLRRLSVDGCLPLPLVRACFQRTGER